MKNHRYKRVLFWSTALADLLGGGPVGGIGVQLMFWNKVFKANGWKTFTLYRAYKPDNDNNCKYVHDLETASIWFWLYLFVSLFIIIKIRPNVIICRGGKNRNLFFLAVWCRIFGIKLVQFFGSDADLNPDKRIMTKVDNFNIRLYRIGLSLIKYFVVQNRIQKEQLEYQFHKKHILTIPNIWEPFSEKIQISSEEQVILWVGNMRKLKRPEWVFEIAEHFPDEKFVMIGGRIDQKVYDKCVELAKKSKNVEYLGKRDFFEADSWFDRAKVLLCTSEYEGFPNTFLQAWSRGIPVLSTVDPSNCIVENRLGFKCKTQDLFIAKIKETLNIDVYDHLNESINEYFNDAHSSKSGYKSLMTLLHKI